MADALPASAAGGMAVVAPAITGGVGRDTPRRVEPRADRDRVTPAVAPLFGPPPILAPGIHGRFPPPL